MGFLDENGLISKTKSMFVSLSNIISRSSMFPSPMQIHETQRPASAYKQCHQLPGLKTLIYEHETLQTRSPTQHLIIHSYTIPQSSSPPPPPPSSSLSEFLSFNTDYSWSFGMDDMLGTESGVYMLSSSMAFLETDHKQNVYKKRTKRVRTMPVEHPPPIPLLARTGNLSGHMPWILARHYGNGRLVLIEEKVKHHEYFEVYRENGRLILELVSLDGSFRRCHTAFVENNDDGDEDEEIELEDLEFYQGSYDQELEKVEEEDESDGKIKTIILMGK